MRISDFLIIIFGIALGLASLRTTLSLFQGGWFIRHSPKRVFHGPVEPLHFINFQFNQILIHGIPLLVVACFTVVCLTLPRQRLMNTRLARRPGFLLCAAVVTAATLTIVARGHVLWLELRAAQRATGPVYPGDEFESFLWRVLVFRVLPTLGFTVFGTWTALMLSGRGKPIPSWLDRFGYILAVIWPVLLCFDYCRWFLESRRIM
jgi:hypothetical protein